MEHSPLFGLSQVMHVGILLLIELEFALTLRLLLTYLSNHPTGGEGRGMHAWLLESHLESVCLLLNLGFKDVAVDK